MNSIKIILEKKKEKGTQKGKYQINKDTKTLKRFEVTPTRVSPGSWCIVDYHI